MAITSQLCWGINQFIVYYPWAPATQEDLNAIEAAAFDLSFQFPDRDTPSRDAPFMAYEESYYAIKKAIVEISPSHQSAPTIAMVFGNQNNALASILPENTVNANIIILGHSSLGRPSLGPDKISSSWLLSHPELKRSYSKPKNISAQELARQLIAFSGLPQTFNGRIYCGSCQSGLDRQSGQKRKIDSLENFSLARALSYELGQLEFGHVEVFGLRGDSVLSPYGDGLAQDDEWIQSMNVFRRSPAPKGFRHTFFDKYPAWMLTKDSNDEVIEAYRPIIFGRNDKLVWNVFRHGDRVTPDAIQRRRNFSRRKNVLSTPP